MFANKNITKINKCMAKKENRFSQLIVTFINCVTCDKKSVTGEKQTWMEE